MLTDPTIHAVFPAPVTVAAVPSVNELLPVIKFPAVNVRPPLTVADEVNVTPVVLPIVSPLTFDGNPFPVT